MLRPVKILRLLRLGRVYRKLDQYLEFGGAVLCLLIVLYCLIAHWTACIWFVLGSNDLMSKNLTFGWIHYLANLTNTTIKQNNGEIEEPAVLMSYLTSLYFSFTCLSSVGFGNVSANTESEKVFAIVMMILGG